LRSKKPSSGGQGPRRGGLARSPPFFFAARRRRSGTMESVRSMSRHAPSPPTASASLLPLLALTAACSFRAAPEWPRILADVRAEYPTVPQVTVEELLAQETDPAPLLLDARSSAEYAVSHLRGALSAPDESAALAALSGVEPGREIVVYCSVGVRSSALAEKLRARGFTRAANL